MKKKMWGQRSKTQICGYKDTLYTQRQKYEHAILSSDFSMISIIVKQATRAILSIVILWRSNRNRVYKLLHNKGYIEKNINARKYNETSGVNMNDKLITQQ